MPIDLGTADSQKDAVAKMISGVQRRIKQFEHLRDKMRPVMTPLKITAKLANATIPLDCLKTSVSPAQSPEVFSTIASELQHEIWSYLDDPADRVILALTSKHHAAIFEDLKFSKQQSTATGLAIKTLPEPKPKAVSKKRKAEEMTEDEPSAKRIKLPTGRKATPVKRSTKQELIPFLQRLRDTMDRVSGDKLRLCYTCLRYKLKSYRFMGAKDFLGQGGWTGKPMKQITSKPKPKDYENSKRDGHRCGQCVVREAMQLSMDAAKNRYVAQQLLR